MKDQPKRPPGRPPKPASEKPEQFSIRLSPSMKFGLQLIANDRQTSLSQTIEYILAKTLREYEIDGQTAEAISEKLLEPGEVLDNGHMWLRKINTSPERLLSPVDSYIKQVFSLVDTTKMLQLDKEIWLVQQMYNKGISVEDAVAKTVARSKSIFRQKVL